MHKSVLDGNERLAFNHLQTTRDAPFPSGLLLHKKFFLVYRTQGHRLVESFSRWVDSLIFGVDGDLILLWFGFFGAIVGTFFLGFILEIIFVVSHTFTLLIKHFFNLIEIDRVD